MIRVPFERVVAELTRVLEALGFSHERARHSATLFAENARLGIPVDEAVWDVIRRT